MPRATCELLNFLLFETVLVMSAASSKCSGLCFCKVCSPESFQVLSASGEVLFEVKTCFDFLLFDRVLHGILKNCASSGSIRKSETFENQPFTPISRPLATLHEFSLDLGSHSFSLTPEEAVLLSAQIECVLEDALEYYGCADCYSEISLIGYLLQEIYLTYPLPPLLLRKFENPSLLPKKDCCIASKFVKEVAHRVEKLFEELSRVLETSESPIRIMWNSCSVFRKSCNLY